MELYHIHSHNSYDDLYKVGNTITIGESYNSMTQKFMDSGATKIFNPNINDYVDFQDEAKKMFMYGLTPQEIYNNLCYFLNDVRMNSREFILEQIRLTIDKELPSRYKCIWLTDEESLDFWKKSFKNRLDSIYKVEVDGNLFTSSESLLPNPTALHKEMYEQAYKYWQPDQEYLKNAKDKEYLFTGELKILKKIK